MPAHLFPQWGFPLTGKMVEGLPYPMLAAMNGGCKLTINGALPAGEPLEVTGRLDAVDDNGQRAILDQKIVTGTEANPEAVVAHLYVFIPLGGKGTKRQQKDAAKTTEKARVPVDARELAFFKLGPNAGLDFAKLTGDFNPVHWVPRWANAFGFRNVILHGFGTLARAIEALNRGLFAGDVPRCGSRRALHAAAGAAGARRRLRARRQGVGGRRAGRPGLPRRHVQDSATRGRRSMSDSFWSCRRIRTRAS